MSNWYVSKLAAQAEYNWQARYAVMAGRAWIYRHAYRAVAYDDDDTDGDGWQCLDTSDLDTSDDYDISWTSDF